MSSPGSITRVDCETDAGGLTGGNVYAYESGQHADGSVGSLWLHEVNLDDLVATVELVFFTSASMVRLQ